MFGFSMAGVCRGDECDEVVSGEDSSNVGETDTTTTFMAQKLNLSKNANVRVSVYDMQGKLVTNRTISSNLEISSEVVSTWVKSAGMYRVVIRDGSKMSNIPVVVK